MLTINAQNVVRLHARTLSIRLQTVTGFNEALLQLTDTVHTAHSDCCFFAPCTNILTYLHSYTLCCITPQTLNPVYTIQSVVKPV